MLRPVKSRFQTLTARATACCLLIIIIYFNYLINVQLMNWMRQAATVTEGKGPEGIFFAMWLSEAVIQIWPCRRCMTGTITRNAFNDVPHNERRERNSQLRSHLTFPSDRIDSATTLGDVCDGWELIIYSETHRCSSQTPAKSGLQEGSYVAPVLLSGGTQTLAFSNCF